MREKKEGALIGCLSKNPHIRTRTSAFRGRDVQRWHTPFTAVETHLEECLAGTLSAERFRTQRVRLLL